MKTFLQWAEETNKSVLDEDITDVVKDFKDKVASLVNKLASFLVSTIAPEPKQPEQPLQPYEMPQPQDKQPPNYYNMPNPYFGKGTGGGRRVIRKPPMS